MAEDAVAHDEKAPVVHVRRADRLDVDAGIAGRAVEVEDGVAGLGNGFVGAVVPERAGHAVRGRLGSRHVRRRSKRLAEHVADVDVQLDALRPVDVVDGRVGEGPDHVLHGFLLRAVRDIAAGQAVELEQQVLAERAGAHARQVEIDRAVAVGVVAVALPAVQEAVAVGVSADGVDADVEADLDRVVA